ncbi:MAG: aldehyde dehydrogenase family protein, partial [Ruminococcus sp.]|nr:aldehyde dehydrogenase family protein [Ruminococcus sp.]
MEYLDNIGKRAQAAKPDLQHLKSEEKNQILRKSADDLKLHATEILAANEKDMEKGRTNGMSQGLLDRLLLTEDRIAQIAEGLYQIAALDDPIGEVLGMKQRPNGLRIGQKRVPLGVVGIIYEARPNVTADAFGLCFKTGNVVILKGGSDAFHSIQAIVTCIRRTLS